jgi:hypothetical protein
MKILIEKYSFLIQIVTLIAGIAAIMVFTASTTTKFNNILNRIDSQEISQRNQDKEINQLKDDSQKAKDESQKRDLIIVELNGHLKSIDATLLDIKAKIRGSL